MSIYETCRSAVREQGASRIQKVKVAIGELSAVEPELLVFAWEAVLADSHDAGCALEVDWRPARQHCPHCHQEKARPAGSWLLHCPDCSNPLRVQGGYELEVVELTFSDSES